MSSKIQIVNMAKIPITRLRKIKTWTLGNRQSELIACENSEEGKPLLDLASNDYLGLSRHPNVISAANKIMFSEGVGAGGSRLITGSRPIHAKLEQELGEWLEREHVLLFPSGFQANLAAVLALATRHTPVIVDRLIHHSLLVAIQASNAKMLRFSHNDLKDLERCLKRCNHNQPQKKPVVIIESLYSMEGTSPAIKEVAALCLKYGANLLVDEAHALGVLGPQGKGLCFGISNPIQIVSGTFGKAFGSGGAFLASNKTIGEHLIQTSGSFRYTTALAPPLAAAALSALQLIKNNPHWGVELQERSQNWRKRISEQGWCCPSGNGPILSLVLGSDQKALDYQNQLEKKGLLTIAIRPPTVPEGTSRLRLAIKKNLPEETITKLLDALMSQ